LIEGKRKALKARFEPLEIDAGRKESPLQKGTKKKRGRRKMVAVRGEKGMKNRGRGTAERECAYQMPE